MLLEQDERDEALLESKDAIDQKDPASLLLWRTFETF